MLRKQTVDASRVARLFADAVRPRNIRDLIVYGPVDGEPYDAWYCGRCGAYDSAKDIEKAHRAAARHSFDQTGNGHSGVRLFSAC